MNKMEPKIDKQTIEKFTKMNINNELVWNKMLGIINDYYIEILNVVDGKKLKPFLNKNHIIIRLFYPLTLHLIIY